MSKKATIVAFRDEDLMTLVPLPFTPLTTKQLKDLPVWLGPRPFLEAYLEFRQLIPYVILKKGDTYFNYRREISGNEERLHGNISMGVGGHVDAEDIVLNKDGAVDLLLTIEESARREIAEEVGIVVDEDSVFSVIGAIRAFDNSVDLHHVAVVCLFDITSTEVELTFEDSIGDPSFKTVEEIMGSEVEKETWTKLVLECLLSSK